MTQTYEEASDAETEVPLAIMIRNELVASDLDLADTSACSDLLNGRYPSEIVAEVLGDLKKTAFHEAGHAVAYERVMHEGYAYEVTIVHDIGEGYAGYHDGSYDGTYVPGQLTDEQAEETFRRAAIFSCAGYAACLVHGWSEAEAVLGCDSDFEQARRRLEYGKVQAVELLSADPNKRAVELVANALLKHKTISGEHAGVLIGVADGEATEAEYLECLVNADAVRTEASGCD